MPDRTPCAYCGKVGFVRRENVIKAGLTTTTFYCGACNRTWQTREDEDGRDADQNQK